MLRAAQSICILLTIATVASTAEAAQYSVTLRQDNFAASGPVPFTLTFTNTPAPTGGGTLHVRTMGNFSHSNENLTITVDVIVDLGILFNDDESDDSFNAPSDHGYNNIVLNADAPISFSKLQTITSDGTVSVLITPSGSVNHIDNEFIEVTLTYPIATAVACCISSSHSCQDLNPTDCTAQSGTYAGDGTSCATYVCFPQGACCLPDGTCQGDALTPDQCTGLGGVFQGNGSTCTTSDCRIKGACCNAGTCTLQAADDCTTAGGTYHGDNTNCSGDADNDTIPDSCDTCPNTIAGAPVDFNGCPPVIPGDFNHDGDVDENDFTTFAACASGPSIPRPAGCTSADFDHDGDVDMNDFGTFQKCFSGTDVLGDANCAI